MFKRIILSLILLVSIVNTTTGEIQDLDTSQKHIYIFTMKNCKYCTILKERILSDPKIIYEMDKIKVSYVYREKVSTRLIKKWKIKSYPTVVMTEKLDTKTVNIIKRWQISGRDNKNYTKNREAFLKFLRKYIKKT